MSIGVLLVEDMRPAQELIHELLAFVGGFSLVGRCDTEAQAVHWLDENPGRCQLVILDLMLREGTGFAVLAWLARHAGIPAIVFSDFATPGVATKCESLGAFKAVSKSDYRQLRATLERYREGA